MVFYRGDIKSISAINNLHKEYVICSGQNCNNFKSLIYAGGMSLGRINFLADLIGFTKANPPFLYLGAPIFVGRPKPMYFMFVVDKSKLRLASWKANLLSMTGRLQLIKYVVQSMMVHYIFVYNWPNSLIKQITSWMHNFIWSGNMDQKKIFTVVWKNCCKSLKDGGLGLRSLNAINSATNLNLFWQFVKGGLCWTDLLASRVKRGNGMISHHMKSSIWTSVKDCYQTVLDNTKWLIGDGAHVNF